MGEHDAVDAVDEGDEVEEKSEEHHGLGHKIADGWHHLEDLTGGRSHIEVDGEDGLSNFEGIIDHQDAEHH